MLVPDRIINIESPGELAVFNKFKQENSSFLVLHSVFLNQHINNISGEIDFMVLVPNHGIFCIEVKGGAVSRRNGMWKYKNDYSNKGPFRQVNDSMHSLRKWIINNCLPSKRTHLKKLLFCTGVVFPGVTTPIPLGTEGEQWQVLYRSEFLSGSMHYYLMRLSKEWHKMRSSENWYNTIESKPTVEDCKYIIKLIRGDFHREYSALNKIIDTDAAIQSFTEEQLTVLDHIHYNDRSLIEGYAGTGKTILAIELFNYYLNNGLNIGLFCFNRRLGMYLNRIISKNHLETGLNGSYVGTLHSYMIEKSNVTVPKENRDHFFKSILPYEFLISTENDSFKKFDMIIIDEAQDLINDDNMIIFNQTLINGLEQGRWVMMGDFYYQNLYSEQENIIDKIKGYAQFTKFKPLTINCRNTSRISKQNQIMTGVSYDDVNNFQIKGEQISLEFVNSNEIDVKIVTIIREYLKNNVPLSNITLLSPKRLENSKIAINDYLINLLKNSDLDYETIYSFKGLENNIIILFGYENLNTIETLRLIYTGISRAKVKLHLIIDTFLKDQYTELLISNYNDKN